MNFMLYNQHLHIAATFMVAIIILAIWELIWKLIALWKAASNRQLVWFIIMGIVNTAGILEIIYLLFFQRQPDNNNQ